MVTATYSKKDKDMAQFHPGNIVKLKSGGPKMTVEGYEQLVALDTAVETDNVQCSWFEGNTRFKEFFQENALEIVAPENS